MLGADAQLDELVAMASPYWAGEHEVIQTFSAGHTQKEAHAQWLRAQCWKESWRRLDAAGNDIIGQSVERSYLDAALKTLGPYH